MNKDAIKKAADNILAQNGYPYRAMHRHSPVGEPCGRIAFYLSKMPKVGDVMKSNIVCMPDGKRVRAYDEVRCGSCGGLMSNIIEDIELDE